MLGIVVAVFRNRLSTVGLTFRQDGPFRNVAYGVAAFCFVSWGAACLFKFQGVTSAPISDVLFQLTMPSIQEELWFRGIMLAMLIEGFTSKKEQTPSVMAIVLAAFVTSFMFWAVHSISTDGNWGLMFDVYGYMKTGAFGLLWVIVRIGTGSLVLPMLLHTWSNTACYFL